MISARTLLCASVFPLVAFAQSDAGPSKIVQTFAGVCVNSAIRLSQIEAFARLDGWKRLEGDAAQIGAAPDPNAQTWSWMIEEFQPQPLFVGVSRGTVINGKKVAACSVATGRVDTDAVFAVLSSTFPEARLVNSFTEAGQEYRVWKTTLMGEEGAIYGITAKALNLDTITLSFLIEDKY